MMNQSLVERIVKSQGHETLFKSLTADEKIIVNYLWSAWARPNQLPPPGDWLVWLLLSGRGFGKTRTGAETTRAEVEANRAGRISLVGKTPADVRDVMIEGESGILAISPPWFKPEYEPSKRRLTWPNGAIGITYSSHEPDQLRGPQSDFAWCDEISSWAYPTETWDNLMFGLRLGKHPRAVVTSTPKPIAVIRYLLKSPNVVITRGSTYENKTNLATNFFDQIISKYAGTRLGRQEIYGEILDDVPGALWKRADIKYKMAPELKRIVVAIDPAASSAESADETGIISVGLGIDGLYYVLGDRSGRFTPDGWARRAWKAFDDFRADRIIYEKNQGGEMCASTLKTVRPNGPIKDVWASRGKQARAEPISAFYEQGKVFHVEPFTELEDQLCKWTPDSGESPDRLDALVWAMTELTETGPISIAGLHQTSRFK
jgi:phage terminase large subunit-like protein